MALDKKITSHLLGRFGATSGILKEGRRERRGYVSLCLQPLISCSLYFERLDSVGLKLTVTTTQGKPIKAYYLELLKDSRKNKPRLFVQC
jgi:hypothetical protein